MYFGTKRFALGKVLSNIGGLSCSHLLSQVICQHLELPQATASTTDVVFGFVALTFCHRRHLADLSIGQRIPRLKPIYLKRVFLQITLAQMIAYFDNV